MGLPPFRSALGAATTDVRRERVRSLAVLLPVDATEVTRVARELVTAVEGDLAADGMAPADCSVTLEADLRFKRQTFELTIPLDACEHEVNEALGDAFRARYAARYGEAAMMRGAPIELVSVRAVGTGRVPSAARVVVHDDRAATAAPRRSPAKARPPSRSTSRPKPSAGRTSQKKRTPRPTEMRRLI